MAEISTIELLKQPVVFKYPKAPSSWKGRVVHFMRDLLLLPLYGIQKVNSVIKCALFIPFAKNLMGASIEKRDYTPRKTLYEKAYGATSVTLQAKDGVTIQGMYFCAQNFPQRIEVQHVNSRYQSANPAEDPRKGPTVLLCVGNDHSVFHAEYEPVIRAYLARGINVMCFDYRGVGLSRGFFSEEGSYRDAEVAVEYIKSLGVPNEKILIEGYSMGSGPATHISAQYPGTNLLLRCPFAKTSLVGDAQLQEDGTSSVVRLMARATVDYLVRYDNCSKIQKVAGSVGIIAAPEDANVREKVCHHAEKLIDACSRSSAQTSSLKYRPVAKHHFSQYAKDKDMAAALDDFLIGLGYTTKIPSS